MIVLFTLALIFGAVDGGRYLPQNLSAALRTTVEQSIKEFSQGFTIETFDREMETTQAFFSNMKFLLLCFLCGISVLGFPGILFLAVYRGYLLGTTMSIMITGQRWTGFAWFFLTIFPQNLLLVPLIIFATAWSANFSLSVLLGRWEGQIIMRKVFSFFAGFFFLSVVALGSAMLQGFVVPYLIDLFF